MGEKLTTSADVFVDSEESMNHHCARICKRLKSPGIYFKESIPTASVGWRAGTSNGVTIPARQAGNRFLGSIKGLQIRALECLRSPIGYFV
jgi:hypothetical protein